MATIEDIDYLWENSEKDSYMIYLDSEKRDKRVFPYPNQYTIEFHTPIKLVYGFDILDAMIPTCMFNVEDYNNLVVVGTVASTRPQWNFSTVNSDEIIREFLDFIPEIIDFFKQEHPGCLATAFVNRLDNLGIEHVHEQDQEHAQNVMVMKTVVGVRDPPPTNPDDFDPIIYEPISTSSGLWYIPVGADNVRKSRVKIVADPVDPSIIIVTFADVQYMSETAFTLMTTAMAYDILITILNIRLPSQNYENNQLQQNLNNAMSSFNILCSHKSAIPEQANKFTFSCQTPFFFNMRASTCIACLGFDELSDRHGMAGCYAGVHETIDPHNRMFLSVFNPVTRRQEIVSPGLLNLAGVRFLVLRCPELEEHAFSGKTFTSQTAGLGVFKLIAGTNGISNLRFDFTNYVKKPFHPIGKLGKLSVRFETPDGELYNFKGVNHHIMLVLKYLVPSVKLDSSSSAPKRYQIRELLDNYIPDVQEYMLARRNLLPVEGCESDNGKTDENMKNAKNNNNQPPASNNQQYFEKQLSMGETALGMIRSLLGKYNVIDPNDNHV